MATLIQFQQRLQKLISTNKLEQILFEEIRRFENVFVNLQKQQLSDGEDIFEKIVGTYSFATEQIARGENPRKPKIAGQPFNFEYTGGFFDGMYLEITSGKEAVFKSKDEKYPLLRAKYKNIFGLQEDNLRKVIKQVILPAFLLQVRKELKLNA